MSLRARLHTLLRRPRLGAEALSLWRVARPDSYLRSQGWFLSAQRGGAVDAQGLPIPWITYPALHLLGERVRSHWAVFEYGAGHSTLWWAGRVAEVVSVEHDAGWHAHLAARLPSHCALLPPAMGAAYAAAASAWPGRFHVVVVDGRDRVACAPHARAALRPDGVVIWDNAERPDDAPGLAELARAGFRRLDLTGLGPVNGAAWTTAILYRDGNCLGL